MWNPLIEKSASRQNPVVLEAVEKHLYYTTDNVLSIRVINN